MVDEANLRDFARRQRRSRVLLGRPHIDVGLAEHLRKLNAGARGQDMASGTCDLDGSFVLASGELRLDITSARAREQGHPRLPGPKEQASRRLSWTCWNVGQDALSRISVG